jgi:hypothetical protein
MTEGRAMVQGKKFKYIVYDFVAISRFFRSVALSIAIQRTTKMEWESYDQNTVINLVYALFPYREKPGAVEVNLGTRHQVNSITDDLHYRFMSNWLGKVAAEGPKAGNAYVKEMENIRDNARRAVQQLYTSARFINSQVTAQLDAAIMDLCKVKLVASVGVAVIGIVSGVGLFAAAVSAGSTATVGGATMICGLKAGAGGTAFAGLGLGHSLVQTGISAWEDGPMAEVVGLVWETGKAGVAETGGRAASRLLNSSFASILPEAVIEKLEKDIARHSNSLAETYVRGAAREAASEALTRKMAQLGGSKLGEKGVGSAILRGTTIPVIFGAWDIVNAGKDYYDTMGKLK